MIELLTGNAGFRAVGPRWVPCVTFQWGDYILTIARGMARVRGISWSSAAKVLYKRGCGCTNHGRRTILYVARDFSAVVKCAFEIHNKPIITRVTDARHKSASLVCNLLPEQDWGIMDTNIQSHPTPPPAATQQPAQSVEIQKASFKYRHNADSGLDSVFSGRVRGWEHGEEEEEYLQYLYLYQPGVLRLDIGLIWIWHGWGYLLI